MTARPLKFYAFEEGREITKPAVIVGANEAEQDPPQSPIYWYDVSIELRANIRGQDSWTREQFGDAFGELKDSVQYVEALQELTAGRLVVFGGEFEGESESEDEGNTLSRTFNFRCLATCLLDAAELPDPPDPIPPPDPPDPPAGYYASVGGLPQNDGSFENPWDLRSALDGTQTIPVDETLWVIDGIYDDPQPGDSGLNVARTYDVDISDVTVRPLTAPNCLVPQPVLIRGGFLIKTGNQNVTIRDFVFENPDPLESIGLSEPTDAGSPYPGFPAPAPNGWDDWGASGVSIEDGEGHEVINCRTYQGKGAFSTFSSQGALWYGCIAHSYGWEATDRNHGHAHYTRNLAPQPAARANIRHNLLGADTRTKKGHYTLHNYATNPNVENLGIEENACKGPITIRSENADVLDIIFRGNVAEEIWPQTAPGVGGAEFNFGDAQTNDLMVFEDNSFINGMIRFLNNGWTNVTESNTNTYKVDAEWYRDAMRGPPADAELEPGNFVDYSDDSGVDQFRLWVNEFAANRAHLAIMDFDRSGMVEVDFAGFAEQDERVCVYHYKDFSTPVIDTQYAGVPINIPVTEETGDRLDMFVVFRDSEAVQLDLYLQPDGKSIYLQPDARSVYVQP